MEPTLVYDAATMSSVPLQTACIAGALAFVALLMRLFKREHGLRTWFIGAAVVMALVAVAARYEKHLIATRSDVRLVEGPVVQPSEWRTRRAGTNNDYTRWQGFWIGEVGFSYPRNVGSNYFSNSGPHALDLHDGVLLRVHYIEERSGEVLQRHIVRVEQLPQ